MKELRAALIVAVARLLRVPVKIRESYLEF